MSDKALAAWHAKQDRRDTIWFSFAFGMTMVAHAILLTRMMVTL